MVFHSLVKKNETSPSSRSLPLQNNMASSTTVKSQPLHNFSLPDLKWAMNHTNTNRFRKLSDSSHKSPQNNADCDSESQRQNPMLEGVTTGDGIEKSAKKKSTAVVSDDVVENSEKKPTASSEGSRSRIFIRIKTKNSKIAEEVADAGDQNCVAEDAEELVPKTWNLRPRKLVTKDVKTPAPSPAKIAEKKEKEKEKKRKFSIPLSKEEIEDDFLTMTGNKPSRRPKKRARNVQKQLDYVFPGLWLASITPDSYRVNDGATKG
ncbi:DUF1639 family protein [Melia azedarach]|uniref:DUF1639 family protein n=1 Tax=Melia azedarach TaxID=155640 RepID=A0ACC1YTW1_MELAZ|nr:DUF1639 family protein [Melia azedarach]